MNYPDFTTFPPFISDPKGRGEHGFSCERFREITPEELKNAEAVAEEMLLPS